MINGERLFDGDKLLLSKRKPCKQLPAGTELKFLVLVPAVTSASV